MYLIAIAWLYVAVMMALAEGFSPNGTWLGAFFTLLLYGIGPVSLLMYLLGTPGRRRARRRAESQAAAAEPAAHTPGGGSSGDSGGEPDQR